MVTVNENSHWYKHSISMLFYDADVFVDDS